MNREEKQVKVLTNRQFIVSLIIAFVTIFGFARLVLADLDNRYFTIAEGRFLESNMTKVSLLLDDLLIFQRNSDNYHSSALAVSFKNGAPADTRYSRNTLVHDLLRDLEREQKNDGNKGDKNGN